MDFIIIILFAKAPWSWGLTRQFWCVSLGDRGFGTHSTMFLLWKKITVSHATQRVWIIFLSQISKSKTKSIRRPWIKGARGNGEEGSRVTIWGSTDIYNQPVEKRSPRGRRSGLVAECWYLWIGMKNIWERKDWVLLKLD